MKDFIRNWKTTLAGVGILITVTAKLAQDPRSITNMDTIGMIGAGIGALMAKDGNVTGTSKNKPVGEVKDAR